MRGRGHKNLPRLLIIKILSQRRGDSECDSAKFFCFFNCILKEGEMPRGRRGRRTTARSNPIAGRGRRNRESNNYLFKDDNIKNCLFFN